MNDGFRCYVDRFGDIMVSAGVVLQPKEGVRIPVAGAGFSRLGPERSRDEYHAVTGATGATFVGGSGRNIISAGVVAGLSSGIKPVGYFRPGFPDTYRMGPFLLEVLGSSSATISDGTDVVAILSTGGTAPIGSYASTTYGATTYNATAAFTLTITAEGGTAVDIPSATAEISAGSAIGGVYAPTDTATYVSALDADWTIVLAADGSGELRNLTDVVATRAAGAGEAWDPSGTYEATTLGKADYNLTTEEPVNGEPWRATVRLGRVAPRVGYVYLQVIEVAGVLDEVNGPFFATSMPANSGSTYYVRLAYSDGFDVLQDVSGALLIVSTSGGGGGGLSLPQILTASLGS